MPLDRRELAQRIALTGPQDQVRGALFHAVIRELQKVCPAHPKLGALEARFGPTSLQELNFYPVADWLELFWDGCDAIEPQCGSPEASLAHLGQHVCRRFLSSLVGRLAVAAALGKTPIERLQHAPGAYSAAGSFGKRGVVEVDPRRAVIRYEREFVPVGFHTAAVQSALCYGGHTVEVRPLPLGLLEFELHIEWT